jgi:carboxypeptidase Taq
VSALDKLREQLAELVDLSSLARLAEWDLLVMMPSAGAPARAQQAATLARIRHQRSTAEEIGDWLSELDERDLAPIDADLVRLARRDWERARRIPAELAGELARASAEGQECWQRARAEDDFAAFAPALARNIELARAQGECLAEGDQSAYEGLLYEYDYGLRARDLAQLFAELADTLPGLVAEAEVRSPKRSLAVGVPTQEAAVRSVLARRHPGRERMRGDVQAP